MNVPAQLPAPSLPPLVNDIGGVDLPTSFTLVMVLALIALILVTVLIVRAKKPLQLPPLQAAPGILARLRQKQLLPAANPWWSLFGKAVHTLRYLSTRREWRYTAPWILLLGEKGSGKSSLAASISTGHRQTLLLRERQLALDGTDWHFYDQGVVIDPLGDLPAAPAASTDGKAWRAILAALEKHRPERPVDAIVLTISARTLLAGDYASRLQCAEQCYEQLFTLQKRFEFAYPVYVVISQCDAVDGFAAFWQPHYASRKDEMWGWSSPSLQDSGNAAENAASAWVQLVDGLRSLQVDAAADGKDIEDGDRFILFPQRFERLREPLAGFLEVVFRPSVYHASLYLRGIYCCGSLQANGAVKDGSRADIAFIDQLFDRKVFAERNLARPTRESIWSRNRLLRRLQMGGIAFFALLALTLATATAQLDSKLGALSSALQTVRHQPSQNDACYDKSTVFKLLQEISSADTDLRYALIPASWFDSRVMENSAHDLAEGAFKKVIIPSIRCHLEEKVQELLSATIAPPPDAGKASEAVAQTKQQMQDYIAAALALEQQLEAFDRLAQRTPQNQKAMQLELLEKLALYVYGEALPHSPHDDEATYVEVLAQLNFDERPRIPPGFKEAVATHIDKLSASLLKEAVRQLAVGGEMIEHIAKENASVPSTIRRLDDWLTWVGKEWLVSTPERNPCRFFGEDVSANLHRLRSEYDYPAKIESSNDRFNNSTCYEPVMAGLAATQLAPYGNLFVKHGAIFSIAPAFEAELRGMRQLANQDFMQLQPRQAFICLSASVGWRPQALAEADRYVRDYQSFARLQGADAAESNSGKRPLYDRLARKHLQAVLDEILSQGQMPLPAGSVLKSENNEALSAADQELAQRSGDFAKVVDPLLATLRLYRQLGFGAAANQITQCARNFSSDMLLRAEALAQGSRLYEPISDKAADKGKESGSDPVYSLGGAAITKDYLARQLQRGQVLGGYAAPFVAFLKNSEAVDEAKQTNSQSASYWDNTLSEMRRYQQFKEPNGQVAYLENYFSKQLADLSYDTCGKVMAAYQGEPFGNDFFSARRRVLENDTRWRCNNRREADAYAQYRSLATRFNRDLAGRFPFAPSSERDASPLVVKSFFSDYDALRDNLRAATANLGDARWQGIRHFLDNLDKSAAFFRANLTAADGPQPIHTDIVFRAHAKQSTGSEQIVNWRLTSGSRQASYPNGASSLDWQAGEMLLLELQWAEQSRFRPVADPHQSDLLVEGNVASFASLGDWALLRFIAAHRPKAPLLNIDGNQNAVELSIPVSSQKVGPAPGQTSIARAYLELSLSGGNGKAPAATAGATPGTTALKLPAFPQKAPLIW